MSRTNSKVVLPPTGLLLMQTVFTDSEIYTTPTQSQIKKAIERDKKEGNSRIRTVCQKLNHGERKSTKPSTLIKTEWSSIDEALEYAQINGINIDSLSKEAREVLGRRAPFFTEEQLIEEMNRPIHVKEGNFYGLPFPKIYSYRRRTSSPHSKAAKVLSRTAKYIQNQPDEDSAISAIYDAISQLVNADGNIPLWRFGISQDIADICPTDVVGYTLVFNNFSKNGDGETEEIIPKKDRKGNIIPLENNPELRELRGRARTIISEINYGLMELDSEDNLSSNLKDRAFSTNTFNPETNATLEGRIITARNFMEATFGDRSHYGYKLRSRRLVEDTASKYRQFAEIVQNTVNAYGCTNVEELFSR